MTVSQFNPDCVFQDVLSLIDIVFLQEKCRVALSTANWALDGAMDHLLNSS